MEKSLLIKHKEFEEGLVDLINNSGLPTVMALDVLQKISERINHAIYIQTQNEINIMASEQLSQAMGVVKEQEEKNNE